MSPRTVVEMAEFFRGFYGVIDGIITQAGGSWSVSSNDGGQHVAALPVVPRRSSSVLQGRTEDWADLGGKLGERSRDAVTLLQDRRLAG